MGLVNARFYFSSKFFWDERATSLEEQVLQPIQDEVEMGLSLPALEQIIQIKPTILRYLKQLLGMKQ